MDLEREEIKIPHSPSVSPSKEAQLFPRMADMAQVLPCLLLSALGVQRTPQTQGNCTNTSPALHTVTLRIASHGGM